MNCDLAEKGRADFVAGTKDEVLYGDYARPQNLFKPQSKSHHDHRTTEN